MRNLAYQIKQICNHTKSGSHSSQASRRRRCSTIARDLKACGFRNLDIQNLKPKHIEALVAHWKERQLAIGTEPPRISWRPVSVNQAGMA